MFETSFHGGVLTKSTDPKPAGIVDIGLIAICRMNSPVIEDRLCALRVFLIYEDPQDARFFARVLEAEGHIVVGQSDHSSWEQEAERCRPDLILLDADQVFDDLLARCKSFLNEHPLPFVLFSRNACRERMALATRAGISAYVVDRLGRRRIQPIIDAAIARFDEERRLKRELEGLRGQLIDSRDVDRAKAIISRRRGITESAALALLEQNAKVHLISLPAAARALLETVELLVPEKI